MSKTLLIIEDELDIREIIIDAISEFKYKILEANNCKEAGTLLRANHVDIVFSDNHLPDKTGLSFLAEYVASTPVEKMPTWVIVSADGSPELMEKACSLGAVDVIQKPFKYESLQELLVRIENRQLNPFAEIMDTVQSIAGIKLGAEKQLLVETRLMRRARLLGINSPHEYIPYFKKNRKAEISELISLLTTHTTEFFREPDHFDYLHDKVFPKFLAKKKKIRIWSAACSTGQEVYSLGISILEFIRENVSQFPQYKNTTIELFGTDIDLSSVESAKNGIYDLQLISRLRPELVKRYFDFGTGELEGLVKVKEEVHSLCTFSQRNLLSQDNSIPSVDVLFLRNVLIYFKPEDIVRIIANLEPALSKSGLLFLGHSESISNLKTSFRQLGDSIYKRAVDFDSSSGDEVQVKATPSVDPAVQKEKLIRVFVIDDSRTIREMLKSILSPRFGFSVVGEAENPIQAEKLWRSLSPDLITLDIHMPEMDGMAYLEMLADKPHPPIVMISSINYEDAVRALRCLELGAVDYIEKPDGLNLMVDGEKIRSTLKQVRSNVKNLKKKSESKEVVQIYIPTILANDLIAIGASTGGVEAIRVVLEEFPENSPPTVIVQHMPPKFSKAFANRLNESCKIKVQEAAHGDKLEYSNAYIAPGGKQMRIKNRNGALYIEITDDPPVNRHRPSVDYMFDSLVSDCQDYHISAALLTGMGADGAKGLKLLKDHGVHTIVQDEESCVVFGMPQVAISLGAQTEILPLPSISYHLFKSLEKRKKVRKDP